MRYQIFFSLFLWGVCACAQTPVSQNTSSPEKYYKLDTSTYLGNSTLATVKDSLSRLQTAAIAAGDIESQLSLKLFAYAKEYHEHLVSDDTTEYRLLQLCSEAADRNFSRLKADAWVAERKRRAANYLVAALIVLTWIALAWWAWRWISPAL